MNSNNRKMKKYFKLLTILCICLISSGCLTMIHYSPSVVEPGKMHLGYSTIVYRETPTYGNAVFLDNSLFLRYGLPYESDIGIEFKTLYFIIPTYLSFSMRQQFSFASSFIDAITIGVGYGRNLFTVDNIYEMYGSISYIKSPFALRTTIGHYKQFIGYPYADVESLNALSIQSTYEMTWKRLTLMPYINYGYEVIDTMSLQEGYHTVGAGIGLYFELF